MRRSRIRLTHDLIAPHPTREGCGTLVGRAGAMVDERLLSGYSAMPLDVVVDPMAAEGVIADMGTTTPVVGASYEEMSAKELQAELQARGGDPKGLRKQELVDALEYDDESRGA